MLILFETQTKQTYENENLFTSVVGEPYTWDYIRDDSDKKIDGVSVNINSVTIGMNIGEYQCCPTHNKYFVSRQNEVLIVCVSHTTKSNVKLIRLHHPFRPACGAIKLTKQRLN